VSGIPAQCGDVDSHDVRQQGRADDAQDA
jgi:hypothetical protein